MSGNRVTTYSADAWDFNFAGLDISTGKGPDEFLKFEQQEDEVTYKPGLDGEGVFSVVPGRARKCTLTLLETSSGNAKLSAYLNASRKVKGGLPAPLFAKDSLGTTKEFSPAAMITRMPDTQAAKEAGVTVWVFLMGDPDSFAGSH